MREPPQARLAELSERFRQRAIVDRTALSEIAAVLEKDTAVGVDPDDIQRIAHRLAGAGGTFGFPGISACAAELEMLASTTTSPEELAAGCMSLALEIDRALGPKAPLA